MGAIELREKWIQSIANVDERFLRMVDALYESYAKEEVDYDISDEHKKILDQRLESHKINPTLGRNWKEVEGDMISKYGV